MPARRTGSLNARPIAVFNPLTPTVVIRSDLSVRVPGCQKLQMTA